MAFGGVMFKREIQGALVRGTTAPRELRRSRGLRSSPPAVVLFAHAAPGSRSHGVESVLPGSRAGEMWASLAGKGGSLF